ncbi:hypothetical protein BDZ94DRAFT_1321832 [Collybia nuda]|uniref:Uncharacterized protein n=1 Tax=Collybia nuda TaxID=64659 RepID=A0A9P5Y5Z3_9AGAR|nr:hypothetical protein BDZ94DRAFT_1321832 [Collybia nuda]
MSNTPNEQQSAFESKHQRYYRKNNAQCKEKAKLRMQKLRAQRKEIATLNAERQKQQADSSTHMGESDSDNSITLTPSTNFFVFHDDYFELDHTFELDTFKPPLSDKEKPKRVPTTNISFGEFIGPSEPKADKNSDTDGNATMHYDIFQELSSDVDTWSRAFGGLAQWPVQLDRSYQAAVESNNVEGWLSDVWGHAAEGRRILHQLRNMEGQLPYKM